MHRLAPTTGAMRAALALVSLLTLAAPSPLSAHSPSFNPTPSPVFDQHDASVPRNFDIRVELAAGRAGKVAATASQQAAAATLAARTRGFSLALDEVSALPKMVLALEPAARLSKAGAANAIGAARNFLRANRALYGLTTAEIQSASVLYVSEPGAGERGATIVRFRQVIDGVPVFGAGLAVAMAADRAVVGTSGTLYPELAASVSAKTEAVSMNAALAGAASDLAARVFPESDFAAGQLDQAGYTQFKYVPDQGAGESPMFVDALRARRVVFPIAAGEAIPAYYVEVTISGDPAGSGPCFSYVISAEDGRVLFRNNLVANDAFTYRVFGDSTGNFRPFDNPQGTGGQPHPNGVPNGFQAGASIENDVTVESLLGPTDPWLPTGATVMTGNNVEAYLDLRFPDGFNANGADLRGVATAPGQFLYTFDPNAVTVDPTVRQSKTNHLFFFNNWLHDVWYQKGFNEASGNAQTDNFGRGGAGADSIKAEGEDRSGTNNANMLTPADGGRPRMQMFRFSGPTPERDSSHDFGIVAHEWMHFMTNRLIGDGNGLNNNQGGSMGEGWGDWNALVNSIRPGDDIDGAWTTGGWATYLLWTNYLDNYYFGIRRYPYSTRFDRFPLTFKDIGPGAIFPATVPRNTNVGTDPSEVHNAGEVWCNMLWEGTAALIKAHGLDPGRDRMMRYVVDGLKLTPSSPTFGQARDAIVSAANAADPYDVPILWQAFAKRGIGEGAVSPANGSFNHDGITESFIAPAALPDDTVGLFIGNAFALRNVHTGGVADLVFPYGAETMVPLAGNWDGGFGVGAESADNPGVYDPGTGAFFLRNSNTPGPGDFVFRYGPAGANFKPVVGDWDGDSSVTVGVYNPSTSSFFLRNANSSGAADTTVTFGPAAAGWQPIAGDWNGDGIDTIGLYNPVTSAFFLKNTNTPGPADIVFTFGSAGAGYQAIVGDWNGDGIDTIGLYGPSVAVFFLRNTNDPGLADRGFGFGPAGPFRAVAGNFDGQ
jgi:extracellular elastinolytic metalloproteinase